MITLENNQILVRISTRGAQLIQWHDRFISQNILWELNEGIWNRVSPILFPFVGKLLNDSYTHNGKTYRMPQHGFARDSEFTCIYENGNQAILRLCSDAKSREIYPFDFEFTVNYEMQENALLVSNTVKNTGHTPMYFGFGAHPGFHIEGDISEYRLQIRGKSSMQRHLIQHGYYTGETEWIHFEGDGFLSLNEEYFNDDALVFKNENIDSMRLWKGDTALIDFDITGIRAPYWGIWKKPQAPFLCLEPWWGIADSIGFKGELCAKEGMNSLLPGESRSFEYKINRL